MFGVFTRLLTRLGIILVSLPIYLTGYKSMKNLIGLIDVICDVYDNTSYSPKDGVTYCNFAASDIAMAMGCKDFVNKNADEIFDFVRHSQDWTETFMAKAQGIANQGTLIFAMANSQMLGQAHGHIAVVRPGLEKNSGKWDKCPSVMNIGSENFIGRAKRGPLTAMPVGANEAFVPLPKFFLWKPSL